MYYELSKSLKRSVPNVVTDVITDCVEDPRTSLKMRDYKRVQFYPACIHVFLMYRWFYYHNYIMNCLYFHFKDTPVSEITFSMVCDYYERIQKYNVWLKVIDWSIKTSILREFYHAHIIRRIRRITKKDTNKTMIIPTSHLEYIGITRKFLSQYSHIFDDVAYVTLYSFQKKWYVVFPLIEMEKAPTVSVNVMGPDRLLISDANHPYNFKFHCIFLEKDKTKIYQCLMTWVIQRYDNLILSCDDDEVGDIFREIYYKRARNHPTLILY